MISKLLAANVLDRRNGDITFTSAFARHILSCAESNPAMRGTVSEWRDIFTRFNSNLSDLTVDEVSAVLVLMDYQLSKPEADVSM